MAPFKALLVEGTSGVGKSTLIDALIRRHVSNSPPRKIRTLIHLAQSHTYGPLAIPEDRGTLTAEDNLQHLDRIVGALEWLHAGVQEHGRPWCFVIIDTLHLTQCVRPAVLKWADVASHDCRLAALGCKLLLLQASPQTIWARGIEPRLDQQFLLVYAKKFGTTLQEIHSYFVSEQQMLADFFRHSVMPKLTIQNDGPIDSTVEAVYRYWMLDEDEPALLEHSVNSMATACEVMSDEEFIRRFEADQVPEDSFHHGDHIRLAFAYHREYPPLQALEKFAAALKRFAAARGKSDRYHETVTYAYFFLIHERMARFADRLSSNDWDEFARRNPDLLVWKDGILSRYYRKTTLQSDLARSIFVLPDKLR
jgi:hypothetical protein